MLNLASTDKIEATTSTAAAIDVFCAFVDLDLATRTMTPGSKATKISSAATTDVTGSPAAGSRRDLRLLLLTNVDATLADVVTVAADVNGTVVQFGPATSLRPGEAIRLDDAAGAFR